MDKNEVQNIVSTFDSYFCEWKEIDKDSLEDKTIFIEEFSMIPNKWMTLIYKNFLMHKNTIYMYGDPNQCQSVEGGSQIHYDYLYSQTFKEMCPKRETLEYIPESCRYDQQTHKMLDKFLKHGKLRYHLNPIDRTLYKNICFLNKTRREVNTECCDRFVSGKNFKTVDFKYNGGCETYKVCIGMPILASQNLKNKEIFNTMEFVIEDISDNMFKVNNEWFSLEEFSQSFIVGFCVTVYKYQGADINENYNIYDVNRMDKKQVYTSLSRTTKFEFIHLDNEKVNNKYMNRRMPVLELTNARFNSLYQNGKIYKVTFTDDKVYIGSTCEDLEIRMKWHLTNKKSQVFKHRNKNPVIQLVVNAPSADKNGYIKEYAERHANKLLNVKCQPLKSQKLKEIKYKVKIENQKELEERIAKLKNKLVTRDDEKNKLLFYDSVIEGKRYKTKARYNKKPKDQAMEQISKKKQELIKSLTLTF